MDFLCNFLDQEIADNAREFTQRCPDWRPPASLAMPVSSSQMGCRAQKLVRQQPGKYGVTCRAQVPRRSFDKLAAGETSPVPKTIGIFEVAAFAANAAGASPETITATPRLTSSFANEGNRLY